MNGRTIARILLAVVVIVGVISLGVTAYNAGVTAGLAQAGQVVVPNGAVAPIAPYVGYGYGYGWGWGHGFGFFGLFGGLLFLILLFVLIRAAFGPRHGWGPGRGWGPGYGRFNGWRDDQGRTWEDRARETHDAWHRDHPESTDRDRPANG